jgi:mRNA interferase HigB
MKIRLIKVQTIVDYCSGHAPGKKAFECWLTAIKNADWNTPDDIRDTFGSADILGRGSNRVVFNIGGNTYRMICLYHFGQNRLHLFVCWIGTHTEYDELCYRGDQFTVNRY